MGIILKNYGDARLITERKTSFQCYRVVLANRQFLREIDYREGLGYALKAKWFAVSLLQYVLVLAELDKLD